MTNVTRYAPLGADPKLGMRTTQHGKYVLFTDYQSKCLEVERLRKALEKIRDLEREPFGFFIAQNIAINAISPPPAAGAPEEADETGAARKDKESD